MLKDFAPISVAASFEMLLAVPANSPYKSLEDVVDAGKKSPGKLNLGAINPGSTQNLSAHLFQQVTGADFTIVTYRTTPDLVTALLRGDVDLGFDYYAGFASEIAADKLRIIATSGEERDPLLKDVPTAKESGFPDYVVTSWNGVAARAGVPAESSNAQRRDQPRLAAPTSRRRRAGSASRRAAARRKKCATAWRRRRQVARGHRQGRNSEAIDARARFGSARDRASAQHEE